MSRRMGMATALLAAAMLAAEPASPIESGPKPKGKVTPTQRTKPKAQSESLKRMLRKAKP